MTHVAADSTIDKGLKKLLIISGILMVLAPAIEIGIQLAYGERPQVFLLAGFFLVGILAVQHATNQHATGARSRRPHSDVAVPFGLKPGQITGEALWLSDRKR